MYACLYRPPALSACGDFSHDRRAALSGPPDRGPARPEVHRGERPALQPIASLAAIAQEFSPRYECHRDDLVSIDVSGLERLLGPARTIGEQLRRDAASRGMRVHVAVAGTRMAAIVLAHARPGVTIVEPGGEAEALAPIAIGVLEKAPAAMPAGASATRDAHARHQRAGVGPREKVKDIDEALESALAAFKAWGLKTLGELAALPSADLASRLGRQALVWQALARGEDVRPLVPTLDEERFESSVELEWPIEGLEPLSFVLTRLLEPLSTRLERRDRGAAVLHVLLRLVTKDSHARRLELPAPMRDVRTLRTLALLDLESHPPAAAIDRVAIVIDPTPGRVLQHTLFTRAQPTPEQLSTLVARLGALMGQDRLGAPAVVDSYRPGAFAMTPFKTEHPSTSFMARGAPPPRAEDLALERRLSRSGDGCLTSLVSAVRRCRNPVPARVAVDNGRPVRVTTDRRGFVGGTVVMCAGPWRTSGDWWNATEDLRRPVLDTREGNGPSASGAGVGPRAFNKDEWDVALTDGAVYRIFQDRDTDAWFIDAIVD